MTRIEYIRQFPGLKNITEEEAACAESYGLELEKESQEFATAECLHCTRCMRKEAIIDGKPAPYIYYCPMKVGQMVYTILHGSWIVSAKVISVTFLEEDDGGFEITLDTNGDNISVMGYAVNSAIFPTREEAEEKLKEMRQ